MLRVLSLDPPIGSRGFGLSGARRARRSRACRLVCSGVVKESSCGVELAALADVMRRA